jgi:hypothetical protein
MKETSNKRETVFIGLTNPNKGNHVTIFTDSEERGNYVKGFSPIPKKRETMFLWFSPIPKKRETKNIIQIV